METSSESTPTMFATNYYVATHWLGNNLILANHIVQDFADDIEFLFDWNEFEENSGEIYQWFLTDCNQDEAEWLNKHFGLMFAYSEKLDNYILCVTHYGTSWDYVYCETDIENAKAELGDRKGR